MKIVPYAKYINLQRELLGHIGTLEDPYGYIFSAINGYPFGEKDSHRSERLLRMAQVRKLWDSCTLRPELVRLVIFRHYRWQIIETDMMTSQVILPETVERLADTLSRAV